jgi:cell wall-associated NlpC family hydrolase
MRFFVALLAVLAVAVPVGAAAPTPTPAPKRSWAHAQIAIVTAAGLMGGDAKAFRPDDPLTTAELEELAVGLAPDDPAAMEPDGLATIAALDARLVRAVGLQDAAYRFFRGARAAGLAPPKRFGAETVARLLGLRFNHPAGTDERELLPGEPATRAEAAFSAARVLRLEPSELERVDLLSRSFALPPSTPWQQRLLRRAVSLVGHPYIWAGTERGYDCSGFVWRVFKLTPYAGGPSLASVLKGRTSFQMSGEVPRARRLAAEAVQPADVLFFGAKGMKSKPSQVDHMGIALGNGWMVHSSRYGVTVVPLEGWWRDGFAWARRPLAEAGLDPLL